MARPAQRIRNMGFVRWGAVELHLSLSPEHSPKVSQVAATSMSMMPTPSMPPGRPPRLPAVSGGPATRRMDCASFPTSIPMATCCGSALPCGRPGHEPARPASLDVVGSFMALLSFVDSAPEPTSSRRATPALLFQHRPGHSQRKSSHPISAIGAYGYSTICSSPRPG